MSFFKYLLTGVIVGGVTFVSSILINNKSIDEQLEKKSPSIEKIIIQEKTKDDELKRRLIGIKEKYLDDKIDIETTKAGKQDKNTYQVVVADRIFNMNEFKGENKHIEDMIKNVDLIVEFYKRHSNADKDLAEFFKYDVYSEVRDSVKTYDDEKYQQITQKDCIKFNGKCERIGLYKLMKEIVEKNKHRGYLKTTETIEKTTETLTKEETLPTKPEKKTPKLPYEIQKKEYKKGGFVEIRKYNDCRMSLYVEYLEKNIKYRVERDDPIIRNEFFTKDKSTLKTARKLIDGKNAKASCGVLDDMEYEDDFKDGKFIYKISKEAYIKNMKGAVAFGER